MPRQKREINWEIVEKRMESGCSGIEIAGALRIDSDTFYRRYRQQYKKRFADNTASLYSAGDGNLKFTQYMKALSGNTNMLTLLGRERLGQGKDEVKTSPFEDLIDLRHENMILRAEIEGIREKLNGNQPQTE